MAANILFLVAEKLAEFLQSAVFDSTTHTSVKWMESELRRICKVLEQDPGLEMNNGRLRGWVKDLTDAAQEIEAVVDNFLCDLERRRHKRGCMGCTFVRTFKDLVGRHKIVGEMERNKEMVGLILRRMPNEQVFGLNKDSDALVQWLVDENKRQLQQMCVLGQPGVGKTTLIKMVYNSTAVKNRFPRCVWASGETYSFGLLEKITREVTGCSKEALEKMSEGYMPLKIFSTLKGKRYLIVLDININRIDFSWTSPMNEMKEAFPNEMNGSRIVVTYNDREYASLSGADQVYELGLLTWENRWKLFLNTEYYQAARSSTMHISLLEEIV